MVTVTSTFKTKKEAVGYSKFARKELPRGHVGTDGTKLESIRVGKVKNEYVVFLVFRYHQKPTSSKRKATKKKYGLFGA